MSMISKQVAELREWSEHESLVEEDRMMADLLFKAADTIEMLSEKVREPKHGEWKINNNGWAYCSECESLGLESYNFCPNCGARMFAKDTKACDGCCNANNHFEPKDEPQTGEWVLERLADGTRVVTYKEKPQTERSE